VDCGIRDYRRALPDTKKIEIKTGITGIFFSYLMGGRTSGGGKISSQKKLRTIASSPIMIARTAVTGIFDWSFFAR
jgi:hypothetical protein